ncbi:hypothetical protein D3C86_1518630 [compost metagenome]
MSDLQNCVGCGNACTQRAFEFDTDHIGHQHVYRLTEHARFSLDATNAPTEHADTINHGGMAVCSYKGVRIDHAIIFNYALSQIFKVDLMANTYARRNNFESLKCLHAPLHQLIALSVALEFNLHVLT